MDEDTVYYSDEKDVRVTRTTLTILGISVPMVTVLAATVGRKPPNRVAALFLIVGGIVAIPSFGLGLIPLAIGIYMYRSAKPTYYLQLIPNPIPERVLTSKNSEYIVRVHAAIDKALTQRSLDRVS